jgi:hypothetical protein
VFAGKTKYFIFFIQNSIFQSNFNLKTPRKKHKHLENPINDLKKQKKKTMQEPEINPKQKLFPSLNLVFKALLR